MEERACAELEGQYEKALKDLEDARSKQSSALPPVVEPLGYETPPASAEFGPEFFAPRRRLQQISERLRECYEKHSVPSEMRRLPL
jgi:hypothetical protein